MHTDLSLEMYLTAIGAAVLVVSLVQLLAVRKLATLDTRGQWRTVVYFIAFFLAAYLFFIVSLASGDPLLSNRISGALFFGGAIFAFIVANLARRSIKIAQDQAKELALLNESLEARVADRAEHLNRSFEFIRTVLDSMRDAIAIVNVQDYTITGVNEAFLELHGVSRQDVIGRRCHEVTHGLSEPCQFHGHGCPLAEAAASGSHVSVEHVHIDGRGSRQHEEIHVYPIRDGEGTVVQAVHVSRDITERKESDERIRRLAYYDNLTGLPNRSLYKELLMRALIRVQREGKNLAVLFIDLDGFKRINDTLGHDAGDQLLQEVGRRLQACLRKSDYVARSEDKAEELAVSRLGGDEFIVLLSDLARGQDAARVAHRIMSGLTRPCRLGDHEVVVSASIGIALFPADGSDAESLLKNADVAMYHAKQKGKNNYQFFDGSMTDAALQRLTMEGELRKAVERGEFTVHFQPVLSLAGRSVTGVEALVRWEHPERGMIPPAEFIPVAEETGLIVPIGEQVLRTACAQQRAWSDAGLPAVSVAVNISRRQFEQRNMRDMVGRVLQETGCSPTHLVLEVTESMIMRDAGKAGEVLRDLRAQGIRIAMDDFGTGYSSLDVLKLLPLDIMKIDRSFVSNITDAGVDLAITRVVIVMAHSLKLSVIAEGVETEEQLATLQELGCNAAQGYLFSKPLPAAECGAFLRRSRR